MDGICRDEDFLLCSGQTIEFIATEGFKGLGRLLTAAQLCQEWGICEMHYSELLDLGLPVIEFLDGELVHPECAIDQFFALLGDPSRSKTPDVVDTSYVAQKLGCTTVWIADQARSGAIPGSCIVPGTGHGKPWKFYRLRIDGWLRERE